MRLLKNSFPSLFLLGLLQAYAAFAQDPDGFFVEVMETK